MKFLLNALLIAGVAVTGRLAAQDTITNFGNSGVFATGWTYTGSTSTISGNNINGSTLYGDYIPYANFAPFNQVTVTADGNGVPISSFLLTLEDDSGNTVSGVFAWTQFANGPATVSSWITPAGTFDPTNVAGWSITSTYPLGEVPVPINVTFTSATTGNATAPAAGIAGPAITTLGSSVTASAGWTYNAANNTVTGTPAYGSTLSGATAVQDLSSATQISLTASATVLNGSPLTYVLRDNDGDKAYAAFNWGSFAGGSAQTVTSTLVPDVFFDASNVVGWDIISSTDILPITATLYGAAAVSSATDTVLDAFTVGITTLNGPNQSANSTLDIAGFSSALRDVQTSGTGLITASIAGGALSAASSGGDAKVALLYEDFSIYAPEQNFLSLDFNVAVDLDEVTIELISANAPGPLGGMFSIPDFAEPGTFYLDLSTFAGVDAEFLAGLKSVGLVFGSSQPQFEFILNTASFTSVPEPTTGLLVATGAAVLGLGRRRRGI
jgi:hypothetical protein